MFLYTDSSTMDFLIPGCTKDMENNHQLHIPFNTAFPIIIHVLSRHPIFPALTKTTHNVPEDLLFHLWRSIEYIKPKGSKSIPFFQFTLPTTTTPVTITLKLDHFRSILGFPEPDSKPGATKFDEVPEIPVMLKGVKRLGYDGELNSMKDFKKKNLHSLWYTLCSIINYCLAPTKRGQDGITSYTLTYLYGVSHNKHLDFAKAAWDHMALNVKGKHNQTKKYIPFIRFFTILIQHAMNTNPNILRFPNSKPCHIPTFGSVYTNSGVTIVAPMPIPDSLLCLVPHEDPDFMNYRVYIAGTMGAASQQRPTPAPHRSPSEGRRSKKRTERDVVERAPSSTPDTADLPTTTKPPKKKLKLTIKSKSLLVDQPTPSPEHTPSPPSTSYLIIN